MKILVCIEEGREREEGDGGQAPVCYDEKGVPLRLQADNEHPLEQALRLKGEAGAKSHVTLLCIGPERAKEALRRGLALGCDRGVLVLDTEQRRDPSQLASVIARFCRKSSFDLILTGAGFGEVGAFIAYQLGCRSASSVAAVRRGGGARLVTCELLETGVREQQFRLPAVMICRSGPAVMRLPTLSNLLGARKKEIIVYRPDELLPEACGRAVGDVYRRAGAAWFR